MNSPSLDFENLLIDSGGFTALTTGVKIPVQKYLDFLNIHKIKIAFNLDMPDVAETLENQKILCQNSDCQIIPIYHFSDWANPNTRGLLESFCQDFDYIGLGGIAAMRGGSPKKRAFFEWVFSIVKDSRKLHGLGIGNSFILDFPFYSVDTTSWNQTVRFGEAGRPQGPP